VTVAALTLGTVARAADVETRDFRVLVDGKQSGAAQMTIQRRDDGTVAMRCDTDITVKVGGVIRVYTYAYRGHETWKDGRLVQFESNCNDDGKRYAVAAAADGDSLRVRVNGQERKARGDVWLTSYWQQPDAKKVNQVVPLLDADNGRDLDARVQYVGEARMAVAGDVQNVRHYKLTGKVQADLWYDGTGRLVRQELLDDGHRILLELTRVRR
jgi:hypothetical protein